MLFLKIIFIVLSPTIAIVNAPVFLYFYLGLKKT